METTVAVEWSDITARDVPYFWVQAGDSTLHHHTGAVQKLAQKTTARDQTLLDIKGLNESCLDEHRQVLDDFFDQTAPEGAARLRQFG